MPYLQKSIKLFRAAADGKSLSITLTCRGDPVALSHAVDGVVLADGPMDSALPPVCSDIDPMKMSNVLRNLLSNAIKFAKKHITVAVDLVPSTSTGLGPGPGAGAAGPGGHDVLITVRDDGAGISAENLPRLFGEGVQFNANKLQGGGGR